MSYKAWNIKIPIQKIVTLENDDEDELEQINIVLTAFSPIQKQCVDVTYNFIIVLPKQK